MADFEWSGMQINLVSGDWRRAGCIIEIPYAPSSVGNGPIYEVDPKTRECKTTLQRFEVRAINANGTRELRPIRRENG